MTTKVCKNNMKSFNWPCVLLSGFAALNYFLYRQVTYFLHKVSETSEKMFIRSSHANSRFSEQSSKPKNVQFTVEDHQKQKIFASVSKLVTFSLGK